MAEPLTKHERFNIQTCPLTGREKELVDSYEATVAALETELARLRQLAEVGEAVEGMPVGFGLSHAAEDIWLTWDNRGLDDEVDETCGQTALATLRELAALRAAKGEADGLIRAVHERGAGAPCRLYGTMEHARARQGD